MMKPVLALVFLLAPGLTAQVPADLARERSQFADWLMTAPNSPLVARALAPIGPGIRVGPEDAEVPFPGMDARIRESGASVNLEGSPGSRTLPRHRVTTIGVVSFHVSGTPGRSIVTVYGGDRDSQLPTYYPYDGTKVFIGPLHPAEPRRFPTLGLDGLEVEATEVGTVVIPDSGGPARLRVYRIPDPGGEESELMIYFRDGTSGKGSYPAGRFVSLRPLPNGQYRLDLNRAQNPFCAYRTVYPCPAPWPGNTLTMAVRAGERYQ